MTEKILFIHGAWVTPKCWDKFIPFFQELGYECVAPPWPYKDRSIEELNKSPDSGLASIGIQTILATYEEILKQDKNQPILIGHSYGGLITQMLLDRGYGKAGIAINSAPPKGILPFYPSVLRSTFWIVKNPFRSKRIIKISQKSFSYAFLHTIPKAEQEEIYLNYVVPETPFIFYESATSLFHNRIKVNFANKTRNPLLLIAGEKDKIVPYKMNKKNFLKYQKTTAITDFKLFPDRTHWIIGQEGWREVAEYIHNWIKKTLHQSSEEGIPPQ